MTIKGIEELQQRNDMKTKTKLIATALFAISGMSNAATSGSDSTVQVIHESSMADFMAANDISTLGSQPIQQLKNITLTMKVTNKGIIYTDDEKGLIFTNAKAFKLTPTNELIQLDRAGVDRYLKSVPNKIIVKAPNEKGVLTVFTDITCGWCQKLHKEIPLYLDQGISLEFILFPRQGLSSQAAFAMSTLEGKKDQARALDALMKGQYPATLPQSISIQLGDHFLAAQAMQVTGTPTLFFRGLKLDGYVPAQALSEMNF